MKVIYNVVEKRNTGECYIDNPAYSIDEALKSVCFYLKCSKEHHPGSKMHIVGNDFYLTNEEGKRIISYKIIEEFRANKSAIGRKIPFCDAPEDWHWL